MPNFSMGYRTTQAFSLASAMLLSRSLYGVTASELKALRKTRLKWLVENAYTKLQQQEFAALIETAPSQLGQWLSGHRGIGEHSARRIEVQCKRARGWLDGGGEASEPELSPMARRLGRAFDAITNAGRQNEAFTEIMDELERRAKSPVPAAGQPDRVATPRRTRET
jgi:hypothetical protein